MSALSLAWVEAGRGQRKLAYYESPGPRTRQFFLYRPATERRGAPLVVSVHGVARNAAAHAYRLMAEAERYGLTIVAPLFDKAQYGQYQQLMDPKTGARSDLAMLDIMDAAARLSSASVDKVLLFGFSGGAQFGHRFVMAHPERVASAVHAAAGWYTFPDTAAPYPLGVGGDEQPVMLNLRGASRVPQHVMIGELDIERDASVRKTESLDRTQGRTRLERAFRWVEAMGAFAQNDREGVAPTLQTLPGVGHSFSAAVERACLPRHVFDRFAKDAGLARVAHD